VISLGLRFFDGIEYAAAGAVSEIGVWRAQRWAVRLLCHSVTNPRPIASL